MDAVVRRRILSSVSAGALAGVLGAGGIAAATGGPSHPADVVEGACGLVAGAPDGVPASSDRDRANEAWSKRLNGIADTRGPRPPWAPAEKASAWFGAHGQAGE